MKTKWHHVVISFMSVLSLICCTADPHEPTWRSVFRDRRFIRSVSGAAPPPSELRSGRSTRSYALVTPSLLPLEPEAIIQEDVSVTCSPSDLVVRVKPAFYGLGAGAQELTLGSVCRSNGLLRPQGDLLFSYPLTACDVVRDLPHGYLVYKYVLHYEPSPDRFPSRAHRVDVNIECHYQRDHSVYQLAVQPTWQTVVLRKSLKAHPMEYQITLMDDSWETQTKSHVYLLGQTVNIQVSARHLSPGLKLFINSCYASPSGSKSFLKYTLIDNFGCMMDSKHEPGSSQFVSRTDKAVRFSLRTFQFTADPDTKVSIHCKLTVTSEMPGPTQKSCTYQDHRWRALAGQNSICECCDSTCVTSKPRRALLEGFAISMPLLVSDQPHTAENAYQQIRPSLVSRSKEDEGERHYKDRDDDRKLWKDAGGKNHNDEKKSDNWVETIHGVTMEPDLELPDNRRVLEDKWSEFKVSDLNEFGESSSGYKDDFSELVKDMFEGSQDEITDEPMSPVLHRKDDLPHPRVQLEKGFTDIGLRARSTPLHPKEEKMKKPGCGEDKDRRMMPSMMKGNNEDGTLDEQEDTWYFTWM